MTPSQLRSPVLKKLICTGVLGAIVSALVVVCYIHWFAPATATEKGYTDPKRDSIAIEKDFAGDSATRIVFLDQGWTPQQSVQFYNTPQGSRLVPLKWFLVLEQPDKAAPFLDQDYIARFRYLPQTKSDYNLSSLPVGFVKDPDNEWMGPTCAACHTTQINYKKTGIRIDGAPGLGDFNGFVLALTAALEQTLLNKDKFDRFAAKVLEGQMSPNEETILKNRLSYVVDVRKKYNQRNLVSTSGLGGGDFGFGRVDAFGAMLNQVMEDALDLPRQSQGRERPCQLSVPVGHSAA